MSNDSMLDIYLFENEQLLEKLESDLLECEKKRRIHWRRHRRHLQDYSYH